MHFDRKNLSDGQLLSLYRNMVLSRMIEEKMILLQRQGKISKWFSGIGQEAISTGVTLALEQDEWIMPLHRNLGVFTGRGIPLHKLLRQWRGDRDGFSNGRERSFHFGTREYHICGMISHLGPQLAVADGVALAHKLRREKRVSLAFTGEGGTSEGDFHEALNVAAVWDLPVIFVIENNGYGLSTPVEEQYRCESLVERARGYGMEGVRIDGNNVLSVYDTIAGVRDYCIERQKPYLVECSTFRMRGHEEASGTKYVPDYLFNIWQKKDPVQRFEEYLIAQEVLSQQQVNDLREGWKNEIEQEVTAGFAGEAVEPDSGEELSAVFAETTEYSFYEVPEIRQRETPIRYIDAVREALHQSMYAHPDLLLMGQDIAEYGGVFKATEGLVDIFGRERVRNTPLCESGVLGTALGLSIQGIKTVVEMQFADFVSAGFTQIVNNIAKMHYRWGQQADVVIRMPAGGGVGAGPFHSQTNEAWFVHTPGLKVVYPSTAADAKGLLIAAINDPNPVMFFEHKGLYRAEEEIVPEAYYEVEIGKARVVEEGEDVSVITYGKGVHWALDYALRYPGFSIDILDLRTLLPLDYAAIRESVKRTGKVLVLHEATLTGGVGAEIAAWIGEHCFDCLDAPVMRCASLDTPVPFSPVLEENFLAASRLDACMQRLLNY